MERETLADLWVLGMITLALILIVPMPWLELVDKTVDSTNEFSVTLTPISRAMNDAGSALAILLISGALLTGAYAGLGLFRWSMGGGGRSWIWGAMTVLLTILALIAFAGFHSMWGRESIIVGADAHLRNWYPSLGFYFTIYAVAFLGAIQVLAFRARSIAVREVINIPEKI